MYNASLGQCLKHVWIMFGAFVDQLGTILFFVPLGRDTGGVVVDDNPPSKEV